MKALKENLITLCILLMAISTVYNTDSNVTLILGWVCIVLSIVIYLLRIYDCFKR